MTHSLPTTLAFALVALTIVPAVAQMPPAGGDVQRLLDARVADAPGTGIVVGVVDGATTTIYKAGSTGNAVPLDEHTVFEIGSVTKTFTATTLASMVRDGSVRLEDPVATFLPASVRVPARGGKQITLLNLATQHSGLPVVPSNLDSASRDMFARYTRQDLYDFLNVYALTRDPGASYEYSTLGIGLLGIALANRANVPYTELLQTRVLAPLGMSDTALQPTASMRGRMAVPHTAEGEPTQNAHFDALAPAGGITSTVDDMLKFVRCNMGQGVLGPTCVFAQQPRDTFAANGIGLVWFSLNANHVVYHPGDTQGFHAAVAIAPDRSRGVVVLANGGAPLADIAIHVLDPSFPVASPAPLEHNDPTLLEAYLGTYVHADGRKYAITRRGGQLYAKLGDQDTFRVDAQGPDRFAYRFIPAVMQFTRDAKGRVNALVLSQGGAKLVFVKPGMEPPATFPQRSFPPVVPLDPATLDGYVGMYAGDGGVRFIVRRSADGIEVQVVGQQFFAVFASAKDRFFYRALDARIDFGRDANGRVRSLVLHQGDLVINAIKQ